MNGPSQQGLDEVAGWARRGQRIGDGYFVDAQVRGPRQILRGQWFTVSWQVTGAPAVVLTLLNPRGQSQQEAAPSAGSRRLQLQEVGPYRIIVAGASPVQGHGARAAIQSAMEIEVLAPRPSIQLRVEPRAAFGAQVAVAWNITDAYAAFLFIDGEPRSVAMAGQDVVRFEACGSRSVKIVAAGVGGESEVERRVAVTAPPVIISVVERHEAEFGEMVVIPFRVLNARAVTIRALGTREAEHTVAAAGKIRLGVGFSPARLELAATGHDGRRVSKIIQVRSRPPAPPTIADELRLLAQPVAEALNDLMGGRR